MRRYTVFIRSLAAALRPAQRDVRHLMCAAAVLLSVFAAKPVWANLEHKHAHGKAPTLRIAAEGWGNTGLAELQFVLDTVAAELAQHFPQRQLGTLRVIYGDGGPLAFYDKSADGEYVIRLSARHARWHQFVYQFAHELCHVYSNFDNKIAVDGEVGRSNQWFEESVCEAAALFTLRKLAHRWETDPPAPAFVTIGHTLHALADYLVNEPHRRLSPARSLPSWLKANQSDLEASPYLRDRNEVVANLLLPLFERDPDALGAIAYLNHRPEDATRRFADYLQLWQQACPQEQRTVVAQIIALFEGRDAAALTAAASPAAAPAPALLAAHAAR
jgi:hypothetical protein